MGVFVDDPEVAALEGRARERKGRLLVPKPSLEHHVRYARSSEAAIRGLLISARALPRQVA